MKLVVISGVSRGLGKALAQIYLDSDCKVLGLGRSSTIKHPHYEWQFCDLQKNPAFGEIDIKLNGIQEVLLINNAGVLGKISRLSDQQTTDNSTVFQINVTAPIELTKKIAILCGDEIALTVLNISSGAARRPIASWAYYCASKAAIDMFSQCFQLEEIEKGRKTKVYSLAPGVIDTDMQAEIRSVEPIEFSSSAQFHEFYESGQLQSAEDVAKRIFSFVQNPPSEDVICRL